MFLPSHDLGVPVGSFLSQDLARSLWGPILDAVKDAPRPPRPLLVVFSGVPLSGKSTTARALQRLARRATVHIENDAVREHLVRALGDEAPTYGSRENVLTYKTTWELVRIALHEGINAIHDATNLTEGGRRGAYAAADEAAVRVVVAMMRASREVLKARAAIAPSWRRIAYEKLGRRQPDSASVSRDLVVIDGGCDAEANARVLLAHPVVADALGPGGGEAYE